MKRLRISTLFIALLVAVVVAGPAFATAKWLSTVVPVEQAKSNWCWAACAEMVIKHYGGTADQWVVVNYIFPNLNYPNYGGSIAQTDQAIDHYQSKKNGMISSSSLSFTAVKYQINNNAPIVVGWKWYGGGGHMVTIRGYDDASPQYVYWCDPSDGYGHKNYYSWFVDDDDHYWNESIFYA